ncbi:hypothetical protein [Spirulina sp. 06S082]|uniref:hypothetical protein n=1 Tax=Spirulina sp. 06S082 TaxID=3110248 RepID=UPI002B216584|nr:hypothetical protein [Spirulina sp. 06S082]MEA5468294.1 hypothetical protein [Spirulina sp. 06S082]
MTLLTKRDILRRYAPRRSRRDSPCSFYTWQETQVMMGGKSRPSPPISLNTDYRLVDRSDELADAIAPLKSAPFLMSQGVSRYTDVNGRGIA